MNPPSSYVIVMGPTGTGKSTFIKHAGGNPEISDGLESCTADVSEFEVKDPDGRDVVFVDTPGFDDTYKSDIEILTQIAEWLVDAHRRKVNIKTILYFHRISDIRMSASPLRNLELFASLCGNIAMPQVIVVTTMWSKVSDEIGETRESRLKDVFWEDLIAKGCEVVRFKNTPVSAWGVLGYEESQVLAKDSKSQIPAQDSESQVLAQDSARILLLEQMLRKRKTLKDTAAGITLSKQLKKLKKDQKAADRKLREQVIKQMDSGAARQLRERKAQIETKIGQVNDQLQMLKRSWFQSILDTQADVPHVPT